MSSIAAVVFAEEQSVKEVLTELLQFGAVTNREEAVYRVNPMFKWAMVMDQRTNALLCAALLYHEVLGRRGVRREATEARLVEEAAKHGFERDDVSLAIEWLLSREAAYRCESTVFRVVPGEVDGALLQLGSQSLASDGHSELWPSY